MKILIVDDEKLTREGIIANTNWDKLGIHEIYEADDGINGIEVAKKHKPDIILSDVRMPRMNGIEMAKALHAILPNSSIIFMSGYSDKEYLKEAIKLKVISYVEKPIDAAEIESSIQNAFEAQLANIKHQITTDYHTKYTQSKLALQIIYFSLSHADRNYKKQFEDLGYQIKSNTEFTTLIITLKTAFSSILDEQINEFHLIIDEITKKYRMNEIFAIKNDEYIILHLFTNNRTVDYAIKNICSSLSSYLNRSYQHFIAVGKTVHGLKNVYESYNSAVLLLQSAFFYEYNSVIVADTLTPPPPAFGQSELAQFADALKQQNEEAVFSLLTSLFQSYKNTQHVFPNYAKDLYYNLFITLIQTSSGLHLTIFSDEDSATVLDYVSKDNNLMELHQLLLDKISLFFALFQVHHEDNDTIYAIKDYIAKNYRNDNLSVKDISEHVYLSSSYVCTLFKNETQKTLNQYLTEFRIEKAKEMLKDSRYKITDISAKVGYSDANYFGKTFKKLVDLSPSEYRERFDK